MRDVKIEFDAASDDHTEFELGRRQFRILRAWLQQDSRVLNDNLLAAPYSTVLAALYDASLGAKPPLLNYPTPDGKKPTDPAGTIVQGILPLAARVLKAANLGDAAAFSWVADEARRRGVRTANSSTITAKQIKSWDAEIGKQRGPALKWFDDMRCRPDLAQVLAGPRDAAKRKRCEYLARVLIISIAGVAPTQAPRRAARL